MSRDFYNVVWSLNSKTCARSLVGRRDRVVWRGRFWGVGVGEREAVERMGQSHTAMLPRFGDFTTVSTRLLWL